MAKGYLSNFTINNLYANNQENIPATQHNLSDSSQQHTEAAAEHGSGKVAPNEVFPTLFKANLGEHRQFSFFHIPIADLPVILYDTKEGLHVYSSVNTMKYAGIYTQDHKTHQVVKTSNNLEKPTLDLSVTSYVCFQWLAMFLILLLFGMVTGKYKDPKRAPTGLQNLLEKAVEWIRKEVVEPNIGGKRISEKFLPYFVGLFFFIFAMNIFGLLPGGHTATGAIGVTAGLAIIAWIVINFLVAIPEIGFKNWFKHFLGGAPWWLFPIMIPIEIISMFVKPFALTIRLFANMAAGHVVLLSLMGLIFYFNTVLVSPFILGFSIFMLFLESLVAFLQAYIFTILTAVFSGLAVGDHAHK